MDEILVLSGVGMAILGLYSLSIGVFGFARKRPLAFSVKTFMWLFLILFLLALVNVLLLIFRRWDHTILLLLASIFLSLYFGWRDMKGYRVVGIYDRTFRDALASTMNELNVRPEETILKRRRQETVSRIKLVEFGADLNATIAEWNGSAQIHIEQREDTHLIKAIADGVNAYYARTPVKVNNLGFVVYLILGIFMLAVGAVFAFAS